MKMHEWEGICQTDESNVHRMRVPGGWIYRTIIWPEESGIAASLSTTFVPYSSEEDIDQMRRKLEQELNSPAMQKAINKALKK